MEAPPSTSLLTRWLFARALGAVLLCACLPLAAQITALIGSSGISPAQALLHAAHEKLGSSAFWYFPSLCWLWSSDTSLVLQCLLGATGGILLLTGIHPGFGAFLGWICYLSLCAVGSPFLDFQWDALLVETCLLAACYLPWQRRPDWTHLTKVQSIARWLLLWLAFRLMLQSGIVKLASGDPLWRNLSALQFHFETQPLPLWTAWYAHHLPSWLLNASTAIVFLIELGFPWLLLGPQKIRHRAALGLIFLQTAILLTGNYAFFNWLSIALCVLFLNDSFWPERWCKLLLSPDRPHPQQAPWKGLVMGSAACVAAFTTGIQVLGSLSPDFRMDGLVSALAPLRSTNTYGLFAVMTSTRPEILLEGSNDGLLWHPYQFRWKVHDPWKRPALVAPWQPRLDWQMWFAALGRIEQNPWLIQFLTHLLQGNPVPAQLLAENPFPDQPPKWIRARLYEYHFTDTGSGAAWWRREEKGLYCPPITLKKQATPSEGQPAIAQP